MFYIEIIMLCGSIIFAHIFEEVIFMPTKQQPTLTADYIQQIVAPAVLYTKSALNMQKANIQFKDNYSPNNIRKIAISPEGTIVYYHVPVGGKQFQIKYYSSAILMECEMMKGYKPIINLIKTPYVCSSIEEIVFITQGSDGSYLTSSEQWYSGDKNLVDFKRLRDIVIYSGTLQQYMAEDRSGFSDELSLADATFIHKDDWYKNYGYRPKYYTVDEPLKKRFEKIAVYYKNNEKNSEKDKRDKERTKTLQEDFDRVFKRFKSLCKCISKVKKLQEAVGVRSILNKSDIDTAFEAYERNIVTCNFYKFSGHEKYNTRIINLDASSDKEALERNIEVAKDSFSLIYNCLLNAMLKQLKLYSNLGEQSLEIAKSAITKEYKGLSEDIGIPIKDCGYPKSIANICADICRLTLRESPVGNAVQYYDPTYWSSFMEV